jgi:hypothetical protein
MLLRRHVLCALRVFWCHTDTVGTRIERLSEFLMTSSAAELCHTAPVVENQLSKVAPGGPCGCRRFRWNFIFLKITDRWDVTMQLAPHPTRPYPKCLPPSELRMSYSSPNTSLKNIRFCKLFIARSSPTKAVRLLLRVSWELQIATFSPFRTSVMP